MNVSINFQDFVKIEHSQPVTNSEFVAQAFGKRHSDVLRKIDELLTQVPDYFSKRNFALTEKVSKQTFGNRTERAYKLTKDGFMLLVMGFTGKAAMQIKIAYIEAFNAMTEKLKELNAKVLPDCSKDKTTVDERTGLRDAVNLLISKSGHLNYSEAYKLIHQRFCVKHIEDLNALQITEAIQYIHSLLVHGKSTAMPLTETEVEEMSSAMLYSLALLEYCFKTFKPLYFLNSSYAARAKELMYGCKKPFIHNLKLLHKLQEFFNKQSFAEINKRLSDGEKLSYLHMCNTEFN